MAATFGYRKIFLFNLRCRANIVLIKTINVETCLQLFYSSRFLKLVFNTGRCTLKEGLQRIRKIYCKKEQHITALSLGKYYCFINFVFSLTSPLIITSTIYKPLANEPRL